MKCEQIVVMLNYFEKNSQSLLRQLIYVFCIPNDCISWLTLESITRTPKFPHASVPGVHLLGKANQCKISTIKNQLLYFV